MNLKKLVTVAIPTRNRPELLARAINSLLIQSYERIEIIVADNASTVDLRPIQNLYADAGIRWFRHDENLGMVGNWNFCLDQAKGELFLMLSDDDVLMPGALSWLASQFDESNVHLAYARCLLVDESLRPIKLADLCPARETGENFIRGFLNSKRPSFPSSVMFHTASGRKAGGYHTIGTATDFALHMLIASEGQVVYNSELLCYYSVHAESLSATNSALESLHALVGWSEIPDTVQYVYRKEIYEYCVRAFYNRGLAAFYKMDVKALLFVRDNISHYPREAWRLYVLTILSNPLVYIPVGFLRKIVLKLNLLIRENG
jgi:glycosyltransferase involved in cell wall biosynthesis